ncbi:MAG: hypothetical protein HZC01_01450 [Candidatus Kerfeldbacteria bacterium]|nr:hypothetical protein [Candidatus Kerfeldbacteria bacterium]
MTFPLVPFIDLLNGIICAFASVRLYQAYQRDASNRVLYFFAQGYLAVVVAYLFFSIPRIFLWDSSMAIAIGFIGAQACLYLSVAYFSKVSMFFISVQRMQLVFYLILIVSSVAMVLTVLYRGNPSFDPVTSITTWDIHPIVSIASLIILGGVLFCSIIFFFMQGIRTQHRLVKTRSFIISGGLTLLLVTAYTYYEALTPLGVLVSDLFSLMSYLVIFFGIIYGRERPKPWATPTQPSTSYDQL